VTTPPAPLDATRARSTPSFLASARTAGMALMPPTDTNCSDTTRSLASIAPTTVPASSRGLGWPVAISPPSSDAITFASPLCGVGSPAPLDAGASAFGGGPW
jgi:hypothetical protein